MLLILGCAAPDGKGSFLDLLLVGTSNITNISSWTNTLNDAITLFGLGRAFHVVSGSHMANKSPAGLLSIIIVITHSLLTYACSILAIVCINKIAHYTKTDADNLSQISWGTADNIYFYVLPQGLGFMGIPQLWSCVYFGLCILLNLNQQITHLIMMEKALSDIYPNLSRYTKYVLTFFCIFTCIDLFGILRAEERFGPPERQERHLRRLFNPRKETKSKRRMQICQHPCLINNQMMKLIVASETAFREQCEEKLMEDYISDED
ncbi:sodium:neurotransmitter symporter family [Holotrichia oblita]|uniref:Sodium:neurotransmitter symporter family n=2 Tax=Holotrichia oblita TaxID=644536 RepID=A0ACB9SWU4_HOLOL|nr:sodium:neurotransmitter symporter family [Holotrichia oblita]KAI4459019.1 sodium:neurotransmitter symporter family [Holotrichia oblita]